MRGGIWNVLLQSALLTFQVLLGWASGGWIAFWELDGLSDANGFEFGFHPFLVQNDVWNWRSSERVWMGVLFGRDASFNKTGRQSVHVDGSLNFKCLKPWLFEKKGQAQKVCCHLALKEEFGTSPTSNTKGTWTKDRAEKQRKDIGKRTSAFRRNRECPNCGSCCPETRYGYHMLQLSHPSEWKRSPVSARFAWLACKSRRCSWLCG